MKQKRIDENGFIPMMICVILTVAGIIYFVFTRVLNAAN